MYRKILAAALFAVLAICVWICVSEAAVSDISSGIVRLHILANSDSEGEKRHDGGKDAVAEGQRVANGRGEEPADSGFGGIEEKAVQDETANAGKHCEERQLDRRKAADSRLIDDDDIDGVGKGGENREPKAVPRENGGLTRRG